MRRKLWALLLTAVMVLSLLSGCKTTEETGSSNTGDGDVIKIGVFEPMTGSSAAGGQMTVEGIELANEIKPEV